MHKNEHKDAAYLSGVRILNSVLNTLPEKVASNITNLKHIRDSKAKRLIGLGHMQYLRNSCRRVKFYTIDNYVVVKDGDTIAACISLE